MIPGPQKRRAILIATSNTGKLRDFAAVAAAHGVEITAVPNFSQVPPAREDAPTFEANAAKKAEHYSRFVQNQMVLADDSGLKVDALQGAPGVRSARYAADEQSTSVEDGAPQLPQLADVGSLNSPDHANNQRLLRELTGVPDERRTASFVCEIAVACNGRLLALFHGEVNGEILHREQGQGGFGYDPLFRIRHLDKTFAELTPEEKSSISHRGQAFRKFLKWHVESACPR